MNTTNYVAFEDFETFMKRKPSYIQEKLLKKTSKEYHLEIKSFMKQDANILPNYRSKNYKIKLLKGKQAFFVQNSKFLSKQEIEAMRKYINEHLGKNFIRPSLSAAVLLVLLVRKLDSKLRFCVDYRALDKIIMKN